MIDFPNESVRLDFHSPGGVHWNDPGGGPWPDENGKEWTWNETKKRWEPYLSTATSFAELTDKATADLPGINGPLAAALELKADAADLGDSATKDVGTTVGTVAAGDHTHTWSAVAPPGGSATELTDTISMPVWSGGTPGFSVLSSIFAWIRTKFAAAPVSIAEGGTGAATAGDARTALELGTISTYSGNQNLGTVDSVTFAGITATSTVTGKNFVEGVYDHTTVGSTLSIILANGSVQQMTLPSASSTTITMPSVVAGASFMLQIKQSGTTASTLAWNGGTVPTWIGTAPTMPSTLNAVAIFSFVASADGNVWYGSAITP